jgi:tRNA G18 (ribose-2'-O)-methylase SpoU
MIPISDFSDPRLEPYRNLRDKQLADRDLFLTEGKRVTERLLASRLEVESVLTDERRAPEMAALSGGRAPLYVITEELMKQVAGFRIHTGVLAVARRPPAPTLDAILRPATEPFTLLVLPIIKEPANLGALIRTAAAFGVTGAILGPECCDPFFRRVVRVSMATVFRLPIVRSDDLERDLVRLRDHWNVELFATVLDDSAEPLHTAVRDPARRGIAILLGHEVEGLEPRWAGLCSRKVVLPMHLGTDSLNVSVAAAVFCYHFLAPTKPVRLPEAMT